MTPFSMYIVDMSMFCTCMRVCVRHCAHSRGRVGVLAQEGCTQRPSYGTDYQKPLYCCLHKQVSDCVLGRGVDKGMHVGNEMEGRMEIEMEKGMEKRMGIGIEIGILIGIGMRTRVFLSDSISLHLPVLFDSMSLYLSVLFGSCLPLVCGRSLAQHSVYVPSVTQDHHKNVVSRTCVAAEGMRACVRVCKGGLRV